VVVLLEVLQRDGLSIRDICISLAKGDVERPVRLNVSLRQVTVHDLCANLVEGVNHDDPAKLFDGKVTCNFFAVVVQPIGIGCVEKSEIMVEEDDPECCDLKNVPCLTSRLRKDSLWHTLPKPRDSRVTVVQNEHWPCD
jgi:hypothetical protein